MGVLRGPRLWGAYLSALSGSLLGLMGYALFNPASQIHHATQMVFQPFCHQLAERSFSVAGNPMCVCHRCFGIYVGLFVGSALALAGVRADPGSRRLWLVATVPMVVHVLILNLWSPADLWQVRILTGALFGGWGALALSLTLGQAFDSPVAVSTDLQKERS